MALGNGEALAAMRRRGLTVFDGEAAPWRRAAEGSWAAIREGPR